MWVEGRRNKVRNEKEHDVLAQCEQAVALKMIWLQFI